MTFLHLIVCFSIGWLTSKLSLGTSLLDRRNVVTENTLSFTYTLTDLVGTCFLGLSFLYHVPSFPTPSDTSKLHYFLAHFPS